MKKTLKFLSNIVLAAMLLLSLAAVLPKTQAQAPTVVKVEPHESIFYSDTTSVGDQFTVEIWVYNVSDTYGYQFKIFYNSDMLFGVSAERPSGHFYEPVLDPANYYVASWKKELTYNATHKYFELAYTLLAPEPAKSGSGVIAKLTFQIKQSPPWKGSISSLIHFEESILADISSPPQNIPHEDIDGIFEFRWAPPTTKPFLSVKPVKTTFVSGPPLVNTSDAFFNIYVWIENCTEGWWVIGAEFKLAYNGTLIKYVGIEVDPWLDAFGDIYLVPPVFGTRGDGLKFLHTAVVLLPHDYPPSEWWWPIEGSGALVKITFEVIHQEEFPWVAQSPLDLYDILFSDIQAEPVEAAPEKDGLVEIQGYILGRMIDVYTQYPEPYGGQGINMPSDAFAPQNEVCLSAKVTYNLDPVQNKPVSFEIKWPDGTVLLTRVAFTDINGIAKTCFRIPWLDQLSDPERVFGVWKVFATVEIADEVVNDTLTFKVAWLMEIIDIETADSFQKQKPAPLGEMWFKVTWEVRSAQPRYAVITVVVYDELGVPIAWDSYDGNFSAEAICVPRTYSHNFTLYIPTWAYVGTATVYANIYTDFPQNGGATYGPEFSKKFFIIKP